MLLRWNCVLKANTEDVTLLYTQKAALALAILLHKYGIHDEAITENALNMIDRLNKSVALSDDFYRSSEATKACLVQKPSSLQRRPTLPKDLTFWRAGDVVSIQIEERFHACYVHEILRANSVTLIEMYDWVSTDKPTLADLTKSKAKGGIYNNRYRLKDTEPHSTGVATSVTHHQTASRTDKRTQVIHLTP